MENVYKVDNLGLKKGDLELIDYNENYSIIFEKGILVDSFFLFYQTWKNRQPFQKAENSSHENHKQFTIY